MDLIFLFSGLAVGVALGWFIGVSRKGSSPSDKESELADLKARKEGAEKRADEILLEKEKSNTELAEERERSTQLLQQLASLESDNKNLIERMREWEEGLENRQKKLSVEFENLANRILDEKSKKFTDLNKSNLGELVNPLKEKIEKFEEKVEKNTRDTLQSNTILKEQINSFKELGFQMTKEADNLAKALKGDSKTQGNWGEVQLEVILEKSGLQKDIHFEREKVLKNENGSNQRPDFIIKLPDEKYLILDSKVSLTAYADYFSSEDEGKKATLLKQHMTSLKKHIVDLGERDYQNLYQINQPDYVMLFVANEPALTLALKEEPELYEKALERNIVLVSTTTLMATLRTISYIWKQDLQSKNAQEIARQAGDMLDKFINFTADLQKLGNHLDLAQKSYHEAEKKLSEGKGNLVRRAENLKDLGVKSSKAMDKKLLDKSE